MEQHYETVCVINPDIGTEAVNGFIKKAASLVERHNGKDVIVDEWGRRRLAYPIRKKKEGHYIIFTYTASSVASKELERMFKIDEDVMRYQTVRLKKRLAVEPKEEKGEQAREETPKAEGGENE